MKSLCRDGGEESSLCALSSHLLPLFICTEAGRMEGEGGRRRRVDCMFSSLAQPLCLQAAGGRGGGGRRGKQKGALEM